MGVTLWIVLAFVLGFLFGRLTTRGSAANVGGPVGIGPPAGAGQASGFPLGQTSSARVAGNPNGAYRVILLDRGPSVLNTIKALRSVAAFDLKSAKDTVDGAPREILRVDTAEQAQAVARAFQGVATVRVDGPSGGTAPAGYGYQS